jgi:uncharacterized protein YcbK (DUF882 family)
VSENIHERTRKNTAYSQWELKKINQDNLEWKKKDRLTKYLPKIKKNLADESSRHRKIQLAVCTYRMVAALRCIQDKLEAILQ